MYVNLLISVVHAAVEGGFLPNDPNFHESEKFEKHFSCTYHSLLWSQKVVLATALHQFIRSCNPPIRRRKRSEIEDLIPWSN